jgi:hypothetical protein
MSDRRKEDNFPAAVEESPEVYNYLKQQKTRRHEDIYTPMRQQDDDKQMGITFSPKAYESTKSKTP